MEETVSIPSAWQALAPITEEETQLLHALNALKAARDEEKLRLEGLTARIAHLRQERQTRLQKKRRLEDEMNALKEALALVEQEAVSTRNDIATIRSTLGQDSDCDAGDKMAELEDALKPLWQSVMTNKDPELNDVLSDSGEMRRQQESLNKRGDAILDRLSKSHGSATLEQLDEAIAKMEAKHELARMIHEQMHRDLELSKKHVTERGLRYGKLTELVTTRVKDHFRSNMKKKGPGWNGSLELDPAKQHLTIKVTRPEDRHDGQPKSGPVGDLKALSGGERSFTLTMLMLAMGSELGSPFFVMDEYDVFLDSITRRISTRQLFQFAAQNQHVQYVFCTPQDAQPLQAEFEKLLTAPAVPWEPNVVVPHDLVKIYRMPAPRDGADV